MQVTEPLIIERYSWRSVEAAGIRHRREQHFGLLCFALCNVSMHAIGEALAFSAWDSTDARKAPEPVFAQHD